MNFHPATLLLAWGGFVAWVQLLSPYSLAALLLVWFIWAMLSARHRAWLLVRRSRWLILSITVLFMFATPGRRLPGAMGDLGMTFDGLAQALEHSCRLLLLLLSLAVLHEQLGTAGLVGGFRRMLAPFGAFGVLRERIVVRLTLVLEYIENFPATNWRGWMNEDIDSPASVQVRDSPLYALDWLTIVLLVAVVLISMFGVAT